jgi:hypothetical protein
MVPSKVWKIESKELLEVLESDPSSGMRFFRRLAEALGQRFINCCIMGAESPEETGSHSAIAV